MRPIILIPARLGSTRLANKMLLEINAKPLIQHVVERALEADIGPVVLATDHQDIQAAVANTGVHCVMTDPALPSGSDRIFRALELFDTDKKFDVAINIQGDLPNISAQAIKASLDPLKEEFYDVATVAAVIKNPEELTNINVVKIALSTKESGNHHGLYFSRSLIPHGEGPHYHHIGLYAYKRHAIERFVTLQPSPLEVQERLEQLRLLENGMNIGVKLVKDIPLTIDTQADLDRARLIMAPAAA
jgi:3-deoxy-manno-octulosonate cytidylyltransferase (CMP-KDO synthetase)